MLCCSTHSTHPCTHTDWKEIFFLNNVYSVQQDDTHQLLNNDYSNNIKWNLMRLIGAKVMNIFQQQRKKWWINIITLRVVIGSVQFILFSQWGAIMCVWIRMTNYSIHNCFQLISKHKCMNWVGNYRHHERTCLMQPFHSFAHKKYTGMKLKRTRWWWRWKSKRKCKIKMNIAQLPMLQIAVCHYCWITAWISARGGFIAFFIH